MSDLTAARRNMVESQIRPNKVTNKRILRAMLEIPREVFVPVPLRSLAYMDKEIILEQAAEGQPARVLMAPMPLASLIQLCAVKSDDLVLDVGCATGYSTAIFSRLAGAVVGLECHKTLAVQAVENLSELEADNADIVMGALEKGYSAAGPYDVILVGGEVLNVPLVLTGQIKDGGRMVAVLGSGGVPQAHLFERVAGDISHRAMFEAAAPSLAGFEGKERFVFS